MKVGPIRGGWRMGTSWLGWLLCQKVLLLNRLSLGRAYGWNASFASIGFKRSPPGRLCFAGRSAPCCSKIGDDVPILGYGSMRL